ncbi:CLUMA_CG000687, isoform A [Clunio marinus]|uniref:CLUMA_CG000687, isoform A n=1 Tax=Clunio marinus TaxID=568069 RepID=A0A1J1HFR3_9DIPT|nr:CLUMA_CG000687, isoform A [Clunio marinus]
MPKDKVKINVKDRLEDNVLDLSLSEIEHVPVKDIATVKRATVLDLSNNNIKFLPKNFGTYLTHLTRLDLSKNQLKFLTDDFGNLINLKHLDLYNNQLESLPVTFGHLIKLRYLDMKGNPLQPALLKVVGPCLTSKDCLEAAKQVIPFMKVLEAEFLRDQKKKEEEEQQRKEKEIQEERNRVWQAKKAARKERIMRERQEKLEMKTTDVNVAQKSSYNEVTEKTEKIIQNQSKIVLKTDSKRSCFIRLLTTFFIVLIIFSLTFIVSFKFFPNLSNEILTLLPEDQQYVFRYFYQKSSEMISSFFQKALSLYEK